MGTTPPPDAEPSTERVSHLDTLPFASPPSDERSDHARAELARRLTIVVDEVGGIKPAARSLGVDVTTMRLALAGKRIAKVSRKTLLAGLALRKGTNR